MEKKKKNHQQQQQHHEQMDIYIFCFFWFELNFLDPKRFFLSFFLEMSLFRYVSRLQFSSLLKWL